MMNISCPPPVWLTAIPLTTVSPLSWLITKQLAESAREVIWMYTMLYQCQTSHVELWKLHTKFGPDSVHGEPVSCSLIEKTVLSLSTVRKRVFTKRYAFC